VRVLKSQCSLFKDLYKSFRLSKVDEETRLSMEQHMKECSYCREWSKSIDENREDKEQTGIVVYNVIEEAKNAVKRAKLMMVISMVLIIFTTVWMSSWLHI
jgi:predicted anti-sigma-YlaC factor YlaD